MAAPPVDRGDREQQQTHGDQDADARVAVSEGEHHKVRRTGGEEQGAQVERLAAEEAVAVVVGSVPSFGSVHGTEDPRATLRPFAPA